jgi:hypothetical protein
MNNENLGQEIKIRMIKMIDISYISIINFIFAIIGAKLFDIGYQKMIGEFNIEREKIKSQGRLFLEICIHFSLIGIFIYIARNAIQEIPFPLNGIFKFEHNKVKEISAPINTVMAFVFLYFQDVLRNKVSLFYSRL